jgi:hypothetical protein
MSRWGLVAPFAFSSPCNILETNLSTVIDCSLEAWSSISGKFKSFLFIPQHPKWLLGHPAYSQMEAFIFLALKRP